MSILLVDNDTKCRKSLAVNINQRGYNVKECSNWKDAIDIIKKEKISLILANAKITNALVFKGSSHKNLPKYILFSTDLKPLTENSILFESLYTKFLCDKITATKDIKLKDKIKIIVTDSNEIIRFGIKSIIDNINTFEFIGGASNFYETEKLIKKFKPNILLLGIDFPKTDEINQWKSLKKKYPDIHFIVLTDNIAPLFIQKNFCQWIDALLLKSSNQCDIVYAITKVMIGGKVLDPLITKKCLNLNFPVMKTK